MNGGNGTIAVERTDRFPVRVWGRDPVRMIQGLITNDLAGLERGAVYAAILTPKGRMLADARVIRRERGGETELLLDLPRAASPGIEEHLRRYMPPMFARWEEVSGAEAIIGVYGPTALEAVRHGVMAGLPAALPEDALHAEDGVLAIGSGDAGAPGVDLVLAADGVRGALAALAAGGATTGSLADFDVLRVEAGRPRYGPDMGEDTIATEAFEAAGLMPRAISFGKGCYTGQEVIVRIAHRGHVNRHLRPLRLGSADPPAHRTPLVDTASGREVGWVTSAVRSTRAGETVALGYVRREFAAGAELRLGTPDGPPVTVAEAQGAGPG